MTEVFDVRIPLDGQCKAEVLVRDTYRRTGRTKSGFELHYTGRQCKRKPFKDGYCSQHYGMKQVQEDRMNRLSLVPDHWANTEEGE